MASIRRKNNSAKQNIPLLIGGLVFFCAGTAFMWFMGLQPALLSMQSKKWPQVSCTVIESFVDRHTDSDGSTYRAVIHLRHFYQDQEYTGGSLNFDNSYSSGRSKKQSIVDNYPVGSDTPCWVNPNNPVQAVVDRTMPGIVWVILPFTSVFVLVGLGLILGALGFKPLPKRLVHTRVKTEGSGYQTLRPRNSSGKKLLVFGGFALFWNGIVSVFLVQIWQSFEQGHGDWFLTLFMIPFVAIGLGLIGFIIRIFLASFNPKPVLKVSEGSPSLGQEVMLQVGFEGNLDRLNQLTITLEGIEKASYSVGTNRRTDSHTFFEEVLLNTTNVRSAINGSLHFTVPLNSMHSFSSNNNSISWAIKIHGDIPSWPDIDDEFPITVRPR